MYITHDYALRWLRRLSSALAIAMAIAERRAASGVDAALNAKTGETIRETCLHYRTRIVPLGRSRCARTDDIVVAVIRSIKHLVL